MRKGEERRKRKKNKKIGKKERDKNKTKKLEKMKYLKPNQTKRKGNGFFFFFVFWLPVCMRGGALPAEWSALQLNFSTLLQSVCVGEGLSSSG